MTRRFQNVVIGQGLAGSTVAWHLHQSGQSLLIIDRQSPAQASPPRTASAVAAGLITPVTGKRLVQPPNFEQEWSAACRFYNRVSEETGQRLLDTSPMLRLFENEAVRDNWLNSVTVRNFRQVEPWSGPLLSTGRTFCGVKISPAGRLNVKAYLQSTRTYFEKRNAWLQVDLDLMRDVRFVNSSVEFPQLDVAADRLILCTGSEACSWFSNVPNNPSRGDILTVRIEDYVQSAVVHRSSWIAPNRDGSQTVGATYDWKQLQSGPSPEGRDNLLNQLRARIDSEIDVIAHDSAVRPTMKDYRPVIGRHSEHRQLFILNGLGSKGSLRAPSLAAQLVDLILKDHPPDKDVSCDRLQAAPGSRRPLTVVAQERVRAVIQNGDTVIDATVGNGFDTCFLADAVGPSGRVIGFDIQQTAIQGTHQRLNAAGFNHVELHCESHEAIASHSAADVAAVMFNLGYLPRSDHRVITLPKSTTAAVKGSLKVLKPGGVLSVLSYRGHDGGSEECEVVHHLLSKLPDGYDLEVIESTPPRPTAPILFVLTTPASPGG